MGKIKPLLLQSHNCVLFKVRYQNYQSLEVRLGGAIYHPSVLVRYYFPPKLFVALIKEILKYY